MVISFCLVGWSFFMNVWGMTGQLIVLTVWFWTITFLCDHDVSRLELHDCRGCTIIDRLVKEIQSRYGCRGCTTIDRFVKEIQSSYGCYGCLTIDRFVKEI